MTLHQACLRDGIRDGLMQGQTDDTIAQLLGLAACKISKDIRVDGTTMGIGDVLYAGPTQVVEVAAPLAAQFASGQPFRLGFLVDALQFVQEV